MIIGVTGSIGSGKSLVALRLAEISDAEHCDTDDVCRQLLMKNEPGWVRVKKKWGSLFLNDHGEIDRSGLRNAIFDDDQKRRDLEKILHPYVREHYQNLAREVSRIQKNLIVEVPLLFEAGLEDDFDYIVTVSVPRQEALRRVMKRDKVTAEHVGKILDAQMDSSVKERRADYVIDNAGTIEETLAQVEQLYVNLQRKQSAGKDGNFPGKTLDS